MTFTDRETRMLNLIATGATSDEIAKRLKYTDGTMRVYMHYLYKKIKVRNKTEAAIWWIKRQYRENIHEVPLPDVAPVRTSRVVPSRTQRTTRRT